MTYGEAVNEITTGLESLGYKAYKGKERTFDEGGSSAKPEDKMFVIGYDGVDSTTITDDGEVGTYKITIEINYTFTDLARLRSQQELFTSILKSFLDKDVFPQFLNHYEDPAIKQLDNRFLGIYKVYYGLN